MDKPEQVSVALNPDLAAELHAAVEDGHYGSVSEVVCDVLQDWQFHRQFERIESEQLRHIVQEGIDSGPSLNGDEVFAGLRARYGQPSTT